MILIGKTFLVTCLLACFVGCKKYDDSAYFNGNIYPINCTMKTINEVVLNPIPLRGDNYGYVAVYDSLAFYMNPKLSSKFFNIFDLNTGDEIGTFCDKGRGPNENIAVSAICNFFEEDNELKTLLFALNERRILKWNISKSIKFKTTVIDTIIPYHIIEDRVRYNYMFYLQDSSLLVSIQPIVLSEEEASLPFMQKRMLYSDILLKDFHIYKKIIKNDKSYILPEAFLNSNNAIKPDGSRVVQAMTYLNQLNIIDTDKGEVIGYRMNGSSNFADFEKKKKKISTNYVRVQASNKYIYASFWGKSSWGIKEAPFINIIYVFDWTGNLIRELVTNQPVHEMWLDIVRNRLYTTNADTDELFYIDLKEYNLE